MDVDYCGLVNTTEDRLECEAAVAYIRAVLDHDCEGDESEFCEYYSETRDFTAYFRNLPEQAQRDVEDAFMSAFGFERSEVEAAFNSVALSGGAVESGGGLPPHRIYTADFNEAYLPQWNLEYSPFNILGRREPIISGAPAGWATPFEVGVDSLAFRESDGTPTEIDARVSTRIGAAYYFADRVFVSGSFEFISTFAEDSGVFNFDLAIEGGYFLRLANHFGFEFYGRLDLGYLMSRGDVTDDEGRAVKISSFDVAVGGGVRAMIRLTDEPVKSNMPYFWVGAGYSRLLNCDFLPPDQLFLSTGFLFNYI